MVSLASSLEKVDRELPVALVPAAARARLYGTATHFPAPLARWIYLECRLDADAGRTDLIVGLERAGRAILAGEDPATPLRATADPFWRRLRDLCRAERARRASNITFLWLEFDLDSGAPARPPTPGVFLDLADAVCAHPARAARVMDAALRVLGHPARHPLRLVRDRCLERLPRAATVPTFGLFPARDPDGLRICFAGVPLDTLPDHLADIGWPASTRRLRRTLAALDPTGSPPHARLIHLDLGPELHSGLGIEFAFDRTAQLRGRIPERAFLDRLVRLGLCSAAKRDALLAWPGATVTTFDHELWPSILIRRLHHIKLVIHPGGRLEAKAYLCFYHRPRLPARDRRRPLPARVPARNAGPAAHARIP